MGRCRRGRCGGDDAGRRRAEFPVAQGEDVLEIKGDMRDWLGKGAKGELARKELGAQKERAKELELRLESTELRLKTATDELQRLRDGMVRQQKRHAEEMAELQRAHQREMSTFAKLVESKWDEREDETLRGAVGVGGAVAAWTGPASGVVRRKVDQERDGWRDGVPAIQVAGDFTFSREPSVFSARGGCGSRRRGGGVLRVPGEVQGGYGTDPGARRRGVTARRRRATR